MFQENDRVSAVKTLSGGDAKVVATGRVLDVQVPELCQDGIERFSVVTVRWDTGRRARFHRVAGLNLYMGPDGALVLAAENPNGATNAARHFYP